MNLFQFDFAMPMVWFAQIRGSTKVELLPREPCIKHCSNLYVTLHEGEICKYGIEVGGIR